jgi:branched-chain amino acid transport system ATP-binding protein
MEQSNGTVLEVTDLTKRFGGLVAVDSLSFALKEREILGIIGPNGAGKTTVFNLITGFIAPSSGQITFKGKDITHAKPDAIARMGIARTFQNIRPFKSMTVLENVMVSAQLHHKPNLGAVLFSTPGSLHREHEIKERAAKLLPFLGLDDVASVEAQSLTHGTQRRLEIARALALDPRVLLLDEPAAGLNATETAELLNTIKAVRDQYGLSIILVEHDMSLVMNLCERLIVLNYGESICEGTCDEVRGDEQVIQAYLGDETADMLSRTA